MATRQSDTDELDLLRAAESGDDAAGQRLLARHRDRLRQMVAVHLDRRLAARVDPSDVVQEALARRRSRLCPTTCGTAPCRSTPGSDSSPGSGCCKHHRAPHRCPAPQRGSRGALGPGLARSSRPCPGRSPDRQRDQPQPPDDPRRAAPSGPGRAGAGSPRGTARSW